MGTDGRADWSAVWKKKGGIHGITEGLGLNHPKVLVTRRQKGAVKRAPQKLKEERKQLINPISQAKKEFWDRA